MLTNFGKALRKLRIDHGEVLRDMAEKLGVSVSFLSAVETGRKGIPAAWVKTLASLYDLTEEESNELERLASESAPTVKIDLFGSGGVQRQAALIFARDFGNLSDATAQQIIDLLHTDVVKKGDS